MNQPYIANFMLCEETREIANQVGGRTDLLLVNPKSIIRTPFVPATPSFSVAIGILQLNLEEQNNIQIKLISPKPSSKIVFDTGVVPLPLDKDTDKNIPLEGRGLNVNLNLQNVPCREEGTYEVEVRINDKESGTFNFYVYSEEK